LYACGFEKERTEELQEVAIAGVPEDPADAKFEGVGVLPDGSEEFEPCDSCQLSFVKF
jgi:hypothetical protein